MRRLVSEPPGTLAHDPQTTSATTRYELLKVLGSGGFGTVYQAWDRDEQQLVALKLAHESQSWALRRFKSEFRTVADVSHENLVSLHELHQDGTSWFFTMEYVDGVPFDAWLMPRPVSTLPETRAGRPRAKNAAFDPRPEQVASPFAESDTVWSMCETIEHVADCDAAQMRMRRELVLPADHSGGIDYDRLRAAFGQVVEALAFLHAAGHLHRDIKPSNVLVTADGIVKLVDFGLVTQVRDGVLDTVDALAGTAHFMAPELSLGARPTPASDWYSAGVMLYLVLTGALPYMALPDTSSGSGTYAPSAVCDGIPADLDRICAALLSADPADRPDAAALLAAFAPERPRRAAPTRPYLSQPRPFVGRRSELRELTRALRPGEHGALHPRVVLVTGEPGSGKTTLVRHALREATWAEEPLVLRSRCLERGSLRLRALDGAVDDLSLYLARKSPRELAQLFPLERRDRAALVALFPVLASSGVFIGEVALGQTIPAGELERRAIASLGLVLARIAREQRVVFVIDDAHWAGAEDLAALRTLMDGDAKTMVAAIDWVLVQSEANMHLDVLLAGVRRYGRERVRQVQVGALTTLEARELAQQLGADDAAQVACEARGNPALIELAARGGGLGPTVAGSLARLDRGTRRALELVALGHMMTVRALRVASGISRRDIARLVEARLVQIRPGALEDEVVPWHAAVGALVCAGLDDTRRRELGRVLQSGASVGGARAIEAA